MCLPVTSCFVVAIKRVLRNKCNCPMIHCSGTIWWHVGPGPLHGRVVLEWEENEKHRRARENLGRAIAVVLRRWWSASQLGLQFTDKSKKAILSGQDWPQKETRECGKLLYSTVISEGNSPTFYPAIYNCDVLLLAWMESWHTVRAHNQMSLCRVNQRTALAKHTKNIPSDEDESLGINHAYVI